MMVYELEKNSIMSVKGIDYICVIWNMTRSDAINCFNSSQLDGKGSLLIQTLVQKKTPIEVTKKGQFRINYFRDIYSGIDSKCYRKSWKELDDCKNIDKKYCCSNYYDANINKYGVKCGTSLKF